MLAGALLCAAGVATGPAVAQERAVYRWTDEAGVVHFSDSPPRGPAPKVQTYPLMPPSAYSDPRQDFFSIINQAQRMAEERRARERARREELEARAELERARREAYPPRSEEGRREESQGYLVPVFPRHLRRFPRTDLREHPFGHPAFSPHPRHRHKPSGPPEPRTGRLMLRR